MRHDENGPLVFPALRGVMGDWVYYSCLMDIRTLAMRVDYADDIHNSTQLSEMIQRQLKNNRAVEIAEYLNTQSERLFNSLVVATYHGEPNWHALSGVNSPAGNHQELDNLPEESLASIGFLTLRGDEKLFALDGQHRLAGIKLAIDQELSQDPFDQVPVVFVAHREDELGLQRTRRLFTTLNKTAKPVSKGDTIALDEDDVMALSVRWLVDQEGDLFRDERIAFVENNKLPISNRFSLTTIGNLYDILGIFFSGANTSLKKKRHELAKTRPPDPELEQYFAFGKDIFVKMRQRFDELDDFFSAEDTAEVVKKYRSTNALYRPVGLEVFATVISHLSQSMSLVEAFDLAAKLPRSLDSPPYSGLMWNPTRKTISNRHKVTTRDLLLYMLDRSTRRPPQLLEKYRKEMDDNNIKLPQKVV